MAKTVAIDVNNISKSFKLPHEKQSSIKGAIVNFHRSKKGYEKQEVLKNVSFNVKHGEFFGIVGRNGSGKSTLLKLLAGIYTPDSGNIDVDGKLTPFIELGVGFSPELSGRENIYLNGALLGFNRKEMDSMYDEIVEFAELERFMDQKLKNYSSGMQVRLAFSIAIRAKSEILVLDEVLAVGDAAFQKKCFDYFMELKRTKATVVLVTHDMGAVRQYCDRALLLERGKIMEIGKTEKVAQSYQKLFSEKKGKKHDKTAVVDRWGNGKVLADRPDVSIDDNNVVIKSTYKVKADIKTLVLGFTVYGPNGMNILEGNTIRENKILHGVSAGQVVSVDWVVPNIFSTGEYNVAIACCDASATEFFDWLNHAATFSIINDKPTAGIVNPRINIGKGITVKAKAK